MLNMSPKKEMKEKKEDIKITKAKAVNAEKKTAEKPVTRVKRVVKKKDDSAAAGAPEQVKPAALKSEISSALKPARKRAPARKKTAEKETAVPEIKLPVNEAASGVKPLGSHDQQQASKPALSGVTTQQAAPLPHKPVPAAPVVEKKPEEKPEVKPEAVPVVTKEEKPDERLLQLDIPIAVKDLAIKMQEKPSVLLKALMDMKIMASINQPLDEQLVAQLCAKFDFRFVQAPGPEQIALSMHQVVDKLELLQHRSPIVTFMGHVDHGKTSLLDAIRKTKVVDSEHGGITQHVSAYRVVLKSGEITFIDTPGHEAFTAMRARGASVTDIVVLVVAADDGIMPQTVEAIDHSRAAGVSIIVAINKIDKAQSNLDRVKKQLADSDLTPEDWGGKTIAVPVSAKTGQGIDDLLEMILLEAQMLELKANPDKPAKGIILEAELSKHRGIVCTLLVQDGTLNVNDTIIVGKYYGKIKAMFDDRGHNIEKASPSHPVSVLGLSGVPQAGEQFFVVSDEKAARDIALKRQEDERLRQVKAPRRISLEDLHARIKEGSVKELRLILKGDTQGSLEAIKDIITKLEVTEIKISIMHAGVGNINSSDVVLAAASDALVLGFNISSDDMAKEMASKEGVDVRIYNIIYEMGNDIKSALEGMLEPKLKRNFLGRADVRKVFKLSRGGTIAGCMVAKGKIHRNSLVSLLRNGELAFEGKISSLKRFKDDVKDVNEGFECGISLSGFDAFQEGDVIEAYEIERIARKL